MASSSTAGSGWMGSRGSWIWLETGHYASRPPGEVHGPCRSEEGCVVLDVSFPQRLQNAEP